MSRIQAFYLIFSVAPHLSHAFQFPVSFNPAPIRRVSLGSPLLRTVKTDLPRLHQLNLQMQQKSVLSDICIHHVSTESPRAWATPSTSVAPRPFRDRMSVRLFAAPRKKLPTRSVDVVCTKCFTKLFKYKKGGNGSLVKCYVERIVEDFTNGDLTCPKCGSAFARESMIHGRPAFKIIGGKATQK